MPSPEAILNGLSLAANKYYLLSIFWHSVILLFLVLLISGKKPSIKITGIGLTLLLFSVAVVAVLVANPFNAIIFFLATLFFGFLSWRLPQAEVSIKWDIVMVTGLILIVFGLVYPHFLENAGFLNYLYASPLGLIPCPTLSVVIGFTLLFHGFDYKKWIMSLALIGLFYGIFGVLRLKVYLDIVLVAGALFLLVYAFTSKKSTVSVI